MAKKEAKSYVVMRNHNGRQKEFKKLHRDVMPACYLKYLQLVLADLQYINEPRLTPALVMTMLFVEDYEFFTADHLCAALRMNRNTIGKARLQPLMRSGMIEPRYHRKNFGVDMGELDFERKKEIHGYRTRYALTTKGRLYLQKLYDKLEGRAEIIVPDSSQSSC